ncbi:uncharacterized protein LOC131042439 [Cryptomeria japonica]|uniref:uncharacterized protein LOC131042439 n=1 Tax=Cryptomeria japonica TaxID=3369 RepID=UPI0025AD5C7A|nr:uncharacterized protein LOC131042439 [Cryptomeria japonica]XP_057831692.1 uncharacterized protein LOC131042439 [Cryptomeria japonica]XP_057831693.1 uncharacterized protein LOC131042439 [Cryptomeria japonica]XP_057831694.1 uncharacterized protein LOC131042439 [Cryptomeria japonica]XP_057831696.1 uncharacterized protein LOC131042439 [Cryptomeria japonica]
MMVTLLDVVRKAAAEEVEGTSKCSLTLNGDAILQSLFDEKATATVTDADKPLRRLSTWKTYDKDERLICAESETLRNLLFTTPANLTPKTFSSLINPFLNMVQEQIEGKTNKSENTLNLLEKVGPYLGRELVKEMVRFCVELRLWRHLTLLLGLSLPTSLCLHIHLVEKLKEAKRSDMLCLMLERMTDIQPSDFLLILSYFLCPSKDDNTMSSFRKERKQQALKAMEMEEHKRSDFAFQQTALLVATAFDRFSTTDFCFHFVVSASVDENVLGWVIERIDNREVLKLVRYLLKWLAVYSSCHLTGPLDFPAVNVSRWVPSLVSVIQWASVILDESFSTLLLGTEFHAEFKSMEETVKNMVEVASGASSLASIVELLRSNPILPNNYTNSSGYVDMISILH